MKTVSSSIRQWTWHGNRRWPAVRSCPFAALKLLIFISKNCHCSEQANYHSDIKSPPNINDPQLWHAIVSFYPLLSTPVIWVNNCPRLEEKWLGGGYRGQLHDEAELASAVMQTWIVRVHNCTTLSLQDCLCVRVPTILIAVFDDFAATHPFQKHASNVITIPSCVLTRFLIVRGSLL